MNLFWVSDILCGLAYVTIVIIIVALVARIRPPGRAGVVTKNVLYSVPPPFSMNEWQQ